MVLTAAVRKQKLNELRQSDESRGKQKLYYQGQTQPFDVYRIDLDWLIYNRHNGRLEAEMLTWEQEHPISTEFYNDEVHQVIGDLLWNSNISSNERTLDDLEEKQQLHPGIVSLDGVIIDGNRRAMLLRRLETKNSAKQYFDAIILPHAYAENQKEIVRLETQYQLGEDPKVQYGPLQKYLHARRLNKDLNISEHEIDKLMGQDKGYAETLLAIMELMDEYLDHIGCSRLYTLLTTEEGMFVDLHGDLKRLKGSNARVSWVFDEIDILQLKQIHFDFIRFGKYADAAKSYREISHHSKGKNFFNHKDIWDGFSKKHQSKIDSVTRDMEPLEDFIASHPEFESKIDAARGRNVAWSDAVNAAMKENFGRSSTTLDFRVNEVAQREYLERAILALEKIDMESSGFLSDSENESLVREINRLSFEMKKKFERANA